MPLENNGDAGSKGSHWEKEALANDFMVANSIDSDSQLTRITLALLKDTNWYADVDLDQGENTPWGKGKGCNFFTEACTGTYAEFPAANSGDQCTFFGHAIGKPATDTYLDACHQAAEYGNADCRTGDYETYNG